MKRFRKIVTFIFVVGVALWIGWNSQMAKEIKAETIYYEGDWLYSVIGDEGDDDVTDETENTVNICGYVGSETELVIPEEIVGMKVTGIDSGAFEGYESCGFITKITIPGSVTNISQHVFGEYFFSLKNIIVDDNNKLFDSRENCNAVIETETNTLVLGCSNTKIPDSVTGIGEYAFNGCSALTDIYIPDSVTSIGSDAFNGCSALTDIHISDSVTSIGSDAFSGCSALTNIHIPENVTSIESDAFNGCSSLTVITVDDNNKLFDSRDNCNAIIETQTNTLRIGCSSTKIPDNVTGIEGSAFAGCSSLTSINIPDSVTSIGESVFAGCSSLTSINIPDSVTSIGESVFAGCSSLTSINIPDSVTSIGGSAFAECSSLTSINIPDSVTSIGGSAFAECSSLTSIVIPENVSSIKYRAFENCSALMDISIPDSVTSIEPSVFYQCSALKNINIPKGIKGIESFTFYGCRALTDISIPESVTYIGIQAFDGCSLTSIKIPASVTSIGEKAFYGCNLTSIQVDDANEIYDSRGGCNAIINTASNMLVMGCGNTTIPESVISIGDRAFWGCTNLTSIRIPASVRSIGEGVFVGCSLTSIQVDDGNGEYDSRGGCNAIIETSVSGFTTLIVGCGNTIIPEGVNCIGEGAFEECTTLTNITIPQSVKYITKRAFSYCDALTDVTISEGVESISEEAFNNCNSLTNISIPKSVDYISFSAFWDCSDNLVMWVVKDSYAEKYAKEYKITIKYLTGTDGSNSPSSTATPNPAPIQPPSQVTTPSGPVPPAPTAVTKPEQDEDDDESDDDDFEDEDEKLKKGSYFMSGNFGYKVTKLKKKKGEIAVVCVKSKNSKAYVIPDKVKKQGITFTVTSIQANTFQGCKKAKTLNIKATGIKTIAKKGLNGLNKRIPIKVPKKKLWVYRKMLQKCGYRVIRS